MVEIATKTKELLERCRQVGYEKVTIFIEDARVPASKKIKKVDRRPGHICHGTYWGGVQCIPKKMICAHPKQRDDKGFPKIWPIVKDCGLTVGLYMGGFGCGEAHDINQHFCVNLTEGYYEL